MAHPCFQCGGECYCHGDIDDVIVCHTPANCNGCGCEEFFGHVDDIEFDDDDDYDEDDDFEDAFEECDECDGHSACRDFGCAIKLGLGHLIHPPL
jgi:hypothetical protein